MMIRSRRFSTNVMGTANMLESIRKSDTVKSAVMITSDKCYENNEWMWGYRETDPMGGHDPYSSSKGCAELVSSAYIRSFFSSGQCAAKPQAIGFNRQSGQRNRRR
jgi:CDP-glucose 4,6-dehydratase